MPAPEPDDPESWARDLAVLCAALLALAYVALVALLVARLLGSPF